MCLRVLSSLFLLRYINDIKLKAGLAFSWPLHIPWSYLYVHFSSFPGQINGIILKGVLKFLGTFFFSNKRLSRASIFSSRGPSKGDSALRYCLAWQCFLQGTDLFLRSQVHVVFLKSNRGARVTRAQQSPCLQHACLPRTCVPRHGQIEHACLPIFSPSVHSSFLLLPRILPFVLVLLLLVSLVSLLSSQSSPPSFFSFLFPPACHCPSYCSTYFPLCSSYSQNFLVFHSFLTLPSHLWRFRSAPPPFIVSVLYPNKVHLRLPFPNTPSLTQLLFIVVSQKQQKKNANKGRINSTD